MTMPTSRSFFAIGPASSAAVAMLCLGLAASLRPGDQRLAWFSAPRDAVGVAVFVVLMLCWAASLRWSEWAVERVPRADAGTSIIVYGTLSVLFAFVPFGVAYLVLTGDYGSGEGALGAGFIAIGILLVSTAISGGIGLLLGFAAWRGRHPARWVGAVGLVVAVCSWTPLVSLLSRLVRSRLGA